MNQENKAGAAILSSSIACFIFGVFVLLVENNDYFKNSLQWIKSVGPLSGEVGIALISWLLIWPILDKVLAKKPARGRQLFRTSLVLLFLAFLFTFPPFFNLFK